LLEIRLLGQFNLQQDAEPVEIPSRPAKTLLAYLLLTLGKHHPRERLAGLLWPDSTENNARKNLRQALWNLRKSIGDEYLLVDNVSIAFSPTSGFWLDINVLEDPAEQNMEMVVPLYEGELLPGYYEDWVLLERDRLSAVYERKIQILLTQLLQEERWMEARSWAERWIAQGQIPEAAYRALMVSFAATGELSKVDEAYQRCVQALRDEIGVDPSSETQTLHQGLMAGEELPIQPKQERPALKARHRAREQYLPAQPTAFIGREEELEEIKQLLDSTRLLTLTGPGGIGKTRLALELAEDELDQFKDGAYFVNLAAIREDGYIIQLVADAIEFPLSTQAEPEDQLLHHLRNRQLLLVMDNFEHLLDGVGVVSTILQAAAGVKILATSREKLELQGETAYAVAGLNIPKAGPSDGPVDGDAIELFMQSARRAHPGYEPSAEDLEVATRICEMIQGMPLAIELATAWLDTLTLEEVSEELQRSLDILSTEMRDVPDRHRSIRAAFDHSWSLINEAEREVFMRLSVFRGGFTRDAAHHVAGASLELLASLVGKSFIRHDPKFGRFEIHELMRQYAEERLEENPEGSLSAPEAHASYFAKFMSSRWDHLRDRRQISALEEIDADIENVRTGWRYRVGQKDVSEIRLFIDSMRRVYIFRGWHYAGRELFESAVEALRGATDDEEAEAVSALAQAHQAFFMALLGLAEEGYKLGKTSVDILERLGRPQDVLIALDSLHLSSFFLRRFSEEEQAVRQMLSIATELDDKWQIAQAQYLASREAFRKRELVEAKQFAESSLKISEESGDWIGIAWPLMVLGHIASAQTDYEESRKFYLRALGAAEQVGFRWGIENSFHYLGQVSLAMEEIAEAEAYFLQSLRVAVEIGLSRDLIYLMFEFARVRMAEGRSERAVELLALVIEHPAGRLARLGEERIRDSAQSLLEDLEAELPNATFAVAYRSGQALELDEVVEELIS